MNEAVTSSETYGKSTSREIRDSQLRPDVQLTKVKNENHQSPLPVSHPWRGLIPSLAGCQMGFAVTAAQGLCAAWEVSLHGRAATDIPPSQPNKHGQHTLGSTTRHFEAASGWNKPWEAFSLCLIFCVSVVRSLWRLTVLSWEDVVHSSSRAVRDPALTVPSAVPLGKPALSQ